MSSWAITYSVDAQSQRIYTFAVGSDNHLHVKYWNWVKPLALWADLGTPSGTLVVTGPGATTYHQGGRTGKQRIYASLSSERITISTSITGPERSGSGRSKARRRAQQ